MYTLLDTVTCLQRSRFLSSLRIDALHDVLAFVKQGKVQHKPAQAIDTCLACVVHSHVFVAKQQSFPLRLDWVVGVGVCADPWHDRFTPPCGCCVDCLG